MNPTAILPVQTPLGPGRLFLDLASDPTATVLLGHGAGGGVEAADLALLARGLPERGVSVVRFEQPWRTAGRRIAVAPPRLDEGWQAAVRWLVGQPWWVGPVFFGGRSAGARVACRTAAAHDVLGVVCLAFPLHPPGRPDRSRVAELLAPTVPRLVLQGTRDAFGGPEEIRAAVREADGIDIVGLSGADHGFRLARAAASHPDEPRLGTARSPALNPVGLSPADLGAVVLEAVHTFVTRLS